MNVLGLSSYPVEAAATRYRMQQYVIPLAERGITLSIRPFLDSKTFATLYQRQALARTGIALVKATLLRARDIVSLGRADVVLVQREAMIFGPPIIEWLAARLFRRPMVLDLDDATYVPYTSPTYGKVGKALKWFRKTDDLIRWASLVTCGNRAVAEYAASKGANIRIIPTVVDTDIFLPVSRRCSNNLVLGWIGTHSTFPYLKTLFPVLQDLAKKYSFKLRIVGAGTKEINVAGLEIENLEWELGREVSDFQSFDVGLYPIDPALYADNWAAGKSGFKAIQYMAVGIPFVASPVGAVAEIGEVGVTHLIARTNDDWFQMLDLLLSDDNLRKQLGQAGRRHAIDCYSLSEQADKLAQALGDAAAERKAG